MALMNFDFEKARKQAEELNQIGEGIKKLTTEDYSQTMQGLSLAWKGDSAEAYLHKAAALEEKLSQTAQQIKQAAQSMESVIRTVEAAEEKARELAAFRQY